MGLCCSFCFSITNRVSSLHIFPYPPPFIHPSQVTPTTARSFLLRWTTNASISPTRASDAALLVAQAANRAASIN